LTTKKLNALRDSYFRWLVAQVKNHKRDMRTYFDLLHLMHQKEFVWLVPNDDNRIIDGTDLRVEFLQQSRTRLEVTREDFGPCSVLEVMIGISRRMAWAAGGEADGWAWQLLDNLGLTGFSDPVGTRQAKTIDKKLDTLIWRTYNADGSGGGFFPLNSAPEDQTTAELWYQMAAYINEIRPDF
jgi:hypothetical protein